MQTEQACGVSTIAHKRVGRTRPTIRAHQCLRIVGIAQNAVKVARAERQQQPLRDAADVGWHDGASPVDEMTVRDN